METDESVRTMDCLRGRLLAERLASRNAKMEAKQLGDKLTELEKQLKQEAKSRNRAEKKLRFLMQKLELIKISHFPDVSEHTGLGDRSDISSPSSSTSSSATQETKQNAKSEKGSENLNPKSYIHNVLSGVDESWTAEGRSSSGFEAIFPEVEGQECEMGQIENPRVQEESENFEKENIAQILITRGFLFCEGDANSEKSSHLGSNQETSDPKMEEESDICYVSFRFSTQDGLKREDDRDEIDNAMALVAVDTMPPKNEVIDHGVLDSTVKQVLDALRHAREQLQRSIEESYAPKHD